MKQSSNSRRSRGRGVGKRQSKNSNFDSNGPEVRVRGSAQQVYEKYLTLARDAMAVGDRIASENYFQHAEHYFRILGAQESGDGRDGNRDGGRNDGRGRRGRGQQSHDAHTDNGAQTSAAPAPAEQPVVSDLAGAEQPNVEMPPQSDEAVPEQTNQPAPETGQTSEPAPEPAEATVERTGAAAAAEAAAADSDTDSTSGDDDGPRDSAVA